MHGDFVAGFQIGLGGHDHRDATGDTRGIENTIDRIGHVRGGQQLNRLSNGITNSHDALRKNLRERGMPWRFRWHLIP